MRNSRLPPKPKSICIPYTTGLLMHRMKTHEAMHSLPIAQATAASLHALLPQKRATSPDEKLVVDAIRALHCWAIPDKRSMPTRLRLRRSVPLRLRIRSSSSLEPTLTSKNPERQVVQSGRHHRSANTGHYESETDPGASIRGQQPVPSSGNATESISEPSSFENSGSKLANSSDLSTEPPEGWPKLSDLPSPVLQLHAANTESEKNGCNDKPVADAELARNNEGKDVVSRSRSIPRRNGIAPLNTSLPHTAPLSSVQLLAKSQRVSPASLRKELGSEAGKRTDKPTKFSQGSTGCTDAPLDFVDENETKRPFPDIQVLSRKKKRTSTRKNTVPKRRRAASQNQIIDTRLTSMGEKNQLEEEEAGFEDSPPPILNDGPLGQPHSAILTVCDRATVSPATSITQKSREQDTDGHSAEAPGSAKSPGSVVVGSSSYDGCSIDMGFGGTNGTCNDIPSRPSSIAWNESLEESIEESLPDDNRVPPGDAIGEKEREVRLELSRPARSRQQSTSTAKQGDSSLFPENGVQEQQGENLNLLNKQTTSVITQVGLERDSHLKVSKNATTGVVLSCAGKATRSNELKHSTRSAPRLSITYHDQDILVGNPANGVSPVSPEEHPYPPGDEICRYATGRRNNSKSPVEANVHEMIICITSFPKEIESELAHEIVMRLGGEVVSSFDTARPHCVVAPVDLQTKEIASSEMAILMALASRIPVVGVTWLTRCFNSGFWVDLNSFETPSSKVKPSMGIFRGIAATFEDAFSRKNAKRKCVEYRKGVEKLITLAEGVLVDTSGITDIVRKDNKLRLLIQIAYDFENNAISTAPKELPDAGIPMCVVSQTWIYACLFSGQCPPP